MKSTYVLICFFTSSILLFAQDNINYPVYKASNATEFLKVLGNDRKIIVSDTIKIIASSLEKEFGVKAYKKIMFPSESFMFNGDGLILHGYKNLTITGINKAAFITYNANDDVLSLEQCSNILLENILIFHETPNGCGGDVLEVFHSENITLNNVDLNGSGAVGLNLINTNNVTVKNSKFYNNSVSAIESFFSSNINIKNTSFTDNTLDVFFDIKLSDLSFNTCSFENNEINEALNIDRFSNLEFTDTCTFLDEGFKESINDVLSNNEDYEYSYEEEVEELGLNDRYISKYAYQIIIDNYFFPSLGNSNNTDVFYSFLDKKIKWENKDITQIDAFLNENNYNIQKYQIIGYEGIGTNKLIVNFKHSFIEEYKYEKIESKALIWEFTFNESHKIINISELKSTLLPSKSTGLPMALKTDNSDLIDISNYWLSTLSQYYFDAIENNIEYGLLDKISDETRHSFYSYKDEIEAMNKQDKKEFEQFYMDLKKRAWNQIKKELEANIIKGNYNDVLSVFENVFKVSSYYYKGNTLIEKKKTNLDLLIPDIPNLENKEFLKYLYEVDRSSTDNLIYELYSENWDFKINMNKQLSRYVHYKQDKDNLSKQDKIKLEKYIETYQKVIENLKRL